MNTFIIPSWYPSNNNPHAGIFNKEQAEALAAVYPGSNFAISTWGSHDEKLLLWGKDHLYNLKKLISYSSFKPTKKDLKENLSEYYTPVFTWSRTFLSGNIHNIIKSSENHYKSFLAEKGKIDVIHAHSAYPGGWIAMVLSNKFHVPYVITEHMTPFPFESFLTKKGELSHFLEKPLLNSNCNIVVSPQQLKNLQEWDIPQLKYIPNLTNESFFKPGSSNFHNNKNFSFFTLVNLVPQKGIPFLLEVLKMFQGRNYSFRLRIGGDGPKEDEYRKLATKLGVNKNIEWLGNLTREEALREFQKCNTFVLPSLHENLPLVLLEAIACGKPVISTRCGGPESIINEKNGLLAEPGDSNSLYQAMEYMLNNSHNYKETEIRADFINRYSRKVICKQIMEVYKEVTDAYGKDISIR